MKTQYTLFDTLLEPTFILNAEGQVIYCNEPAALICELSVRKISRGMKFKDLLTFSEPIEGLEDLNRVQDPTPYKELNFESPSGQKGKVQVTLQPVQSPEGQQHWLIFVRDVTLEERLQKKYRAELEQKEDVILALQKAQAELEEYSKNLEKMVEERTEQISAMNRLMKALLDSLSQGFFVFDKDGRCMNFSSRACETTLETKPDGAMIWDVLKLSEKQLDGFKKWSSTLFSEMLPFEDLAPLGPTQYPHSSGRHVALEYFPLRNSQQQIDGVVVVASDITSLVEARKQAEYEKQHAKMIIHFIHSKNEVSRFIREAQALFRDMQSLLQQDRAAWNLEGVFRCLHTLKGGAGLFSIQPLMEACHYAETRLTQYQEAPDTIKAELLLSQCQAAELQFHQFLSQITEILGPTVLARDRILEVPVSELQQLLNQLKQVPSAKPLIESVLAPKLYEPVKNFFEPYRDVVFRLAEKEGKLLRHVEFENNLLPVLPEVYTSLFGTFVHAFRNAVDHGIETPFQRRQAGKPEGGELVLRFEKRDLPAPTLAITLQDDGGGVNADKIRQILIQKGLDVSDETDYEVIQHIFDSQFSTKENVTEISGRGIGMDAIKYEVNQLGGKIWMESRWGQGSTLHVEVPYILDLPVKRAAS